MLPNTASRCCIGLCIFTGYFCTGPAALCICFCSHTRSGRPQTEDETWWTLVFQEWGLDVQKSSFLSGLPWALSFALANLAGWSADTLINKKILSITNTRKLMQGIASMGPATCLTALALQPSGPGRMNALCTHPPCCSCLPCLYSLCSASVQTLRCIFACAW